jgi:S-adenosylmethionine:tRNA ribosyltransferase-isomerase
MTPALTDQDLKSADFEYTLPPERIAQTPMAPRDHSRLMVLRRAATALEHRRFYDLAEYLQPGDVLTLNVTRVFPARLRGHKRTGGKVELLLLRPESASRWQALIRGASAPGIELVFPENLTAQLESVLQNGEWIVRFSQEQLRDYLERHGEMPLPPYIKRTEKNPADHDTYQTVFAREEGSVAAPTASFHFTPALLDSLRAKGVQIVEIVLHVGWGTFRPLRAEKVREHTMLPEWYSVSGPSADQLTQARQQGRRVIAVGTTVTRTLESIYNRESGRYQAGDGSTALFIYPGYRFSAIDALITNFHLPHSTPLLLACAFYGGPEAFSLAPAYHAAISEGYRFYSYGDAMLIQ